MKKIFNNKKLLGFCLFAALFISCNEPEVEMNIFKTPDWTKNPKGYQDLPAVIEDGSGSNVNEKIMTGIINLPAKDMPIKNVIFMFYDNLTDDLIASAEAKCGELITNDLPQKMTFTSQKLDENINEDNVVGLYLTDSLYKKLGYATTDLITNSVFRQFRGTLSSKTSPEDLATNIVAENPRPRFILGKDTPDELGKKASKEQYLNEFYKGCYKFTADFKEAVSCYNSEEVFFKGTGSHEDKYEEANAVFNIFDSSVKEYPSTVQIVKFGLAWTESKADPDNGFGFVFYDSAKNEDKEVAFKNFDESVAVAAKYVLENPDSILIVTSAALDGSTIPAFALGNNVEKGKDCKTLLNFVKTVVKED